MVNRLNPVMISCSGTSSSASSILASLFFIGGYQYGYSWENDVWFSSNSAASWSLKSSSPPFSLRQYAAGGCVQPVKGV